MQEGYYEDGDVAKIGFLTVICAQDNDRDRCSRCCFGRVDNDGCFYGDRSDLGPCDFLERADNNSVRWEILKDERECGEPRLFDDITLANYWGERIEKYLDDGDVYKLRRLFRQSDEIESDFLTAAKHRLRSSDGEIRYYPGWDEYLEQSLLNARQDFKFVDGVLKAIEDWSRAEWLANTDGMDK